MADQKRYTAEQLADLAGVSLRTVRYYVQEELIDRPLARGPGAHFTDTHLRQLQRCKLLQDWGFDLETIRDKSDDFQSILDRFAVDGEVLSQGAMLRALFGSPGNLPPGLPHAKAEALKAAVQSLRGRTSPPVRRQGAAFEVVAISRGVHLTIDTGRYDLSAPRDLLALSKLIRAALEPLKRKSDDED